MATPATAQGTWLSAEEAGYLTAGPRRAAETVLARLIDTGLVRVSRDGFVSAVRQSGRGATTSVEARMLGQARNVVPFDEIVPSAATSTEMAQLHQHLLDRKLMQRPRRRNEGWWFSLAAAGVLVVLGFANPTFFLGALIALGFFVWQYGRSPVTQAGKDALKHVTAHDRVHAVALYGFDGRVGGQSVSELFDLPQSIVRTVPPKSRGSRRRSSSDTGRASASSCGGCGSTSSGCGSSSSSCSSSSSGSSCGGGGSSCGGGGGGS